jgi:hypothetical protein
MVAAVDPESGGGDALPTIPQRGWQRFLAS